MVGMDARGTATAHNRPAHSDRSLTTLDQLNLLKDDIVAIRIKIVLHEKVETHCAYSPNRLAIALPSKPSSSIRLPP